jgi:hypothetical protein
MSSSTANLWINSENSEILFPQARIARSATKKPLRAKLPAFATGKRFDRKNEERAPKTHIGTRSRVMPLLLANLSYALRRRRSRASAPSPASSEADGSGIARKAMSLPPVNVLVVESAL